MAFKLRSGNSTTFKNMGTSPFKDMKTGSYKQSFESPAKQRLKKEGEAQDEDKIFNDKGEHVGDWVNDKKVMHVQKDPKDTSIKPKPKKEEGIQKIGDLERGKGGFKEMKKKSPAKQTDTTWADGSKKSKRQIAEQTMHPSEYWYKINGKKATKAQYIKYQNKPGGDEPGKQTNDPTVSLAKQSADKRIKLNK